jgi:SAM-dependent methyltransferase
MERYTGMVASYECDSPVVLGRFNALFGYARQFASSQLGDGLDIGAGPGGGYAKLFENASNLDCCDTDDAILASISHEKCNRKFVYFLGGSDVLPFDDNCKDFVVCSHVIHHLGSSGELDIALRDISRVLRRGGALYLVFKAGTHDHTLTHYSTFYNGERTLRVFDPLVVKDMASRHGLCLDQEVDTVCDEMFIDPNYLANCCLVLRKL